MLMMMMIPELRTCRSTWSLLVVASSRFESTTTTWSSSSTFVDWWRHEDDKTEDDVACNCLRTTVVSSRCIRTPADVRMLDDVIIQSLILKLRYDSLLPATRQHAIHIES